MLVEFFYKMAKKSWKSWFLSSYTIKLLNFSAFYHSPEFFKKKGEEEV